jgi:hypothetical protein
MIMLRHAPMLQAITNATITKRAGEIAGHRRRAARRIDDVSQHSAKKHG